MTEYRPHLTQIQGNLQMQQKQSAYTLLKVQSPKATNIEQSSQNHLPTQYGWINESLKQQSPKKYLTNYNNISLVCETGTLLAQRYAASQTQQESLSRVPQVIPDLKNIKLLNIRDDQSKHPQSHVQDLQQYQQKLQNLMQTSKVFNQAANLSTQHSFISNLNFPTKDFQKLPHAFNQPIIQTNNETIEIKDSVIDTISHFEVRAEITNRATFNEAIELLQQMYSLDFKTCEVVIQQHEAVNQEKSPVFDKKSKKLKKIKAKNDLTTNQNPNTVTLSKFITNSINKRPKTSSKLDSGSKDHDDEEQIDYGGGKNYEKVLAKNRPVTPPNTPLIYSAYLQNIVHTVSRNLTGFTAPSIQVVIFPQTKLIFPIDHQFIQNCQNATTILPRVQKQLTRGLAGLREKNQSMTKLVIKYLNLTQTDTVPFQMKSSKQNQLQRQVAFNSSVVEEPTKLRYFDKDRMSEIQMERCADLLYVKVQRVNMPPLPDWETDNPSFDKSPAKQKVVLQPIVSLSNQAQTQKVFYRIKPKEVVGQSEFSDATNPQMNSDKFLEQVSGPFLFQPSETRNIEEILQQRSKSNSLTLNPMVSLLANPLKIKQIPLHEVVQPVENQLQHQFLKLKNYISKTQNISDQNEIKQVQRKLRGFTENSAKEPVQQLVFEELKEMMIVIKHSSIRKLRRKNEKKIATNLEQSQAQNFLEKPQQFQKDDKQKKLPNIMLSQQQLSKQRDSSTQLRTPTNSQIMSFEQHPLMNDRQRVINQQPLSTDGTIATGTAQSRYSKSGTNQVSRNDKFCVSSKQRKAEFQSIYGGSTGVKVVTGLSFGS